MANKVRFFIEDYHDFENVWEEKIECEPETIPGISKRELLSLFFDPQELKDIKIFRQEKIGDKYHTVQSDLTETKYKKNFPVFRKDFAEGSIKYPSAKQKLKRLKGIVGVLRRTVRTESGEYDVTVELRSRFDKSKNPYFLLALLSSVLQGDVKYTTDNIAGENKDLFGFLAVFLFRNALKTAYSSGVYRTYVRRGYNDLKLRGAIDIARHIRLNGGNDSRIAYNTRELTADNPLNHLIVYTWALLVGTYPHIAHSITAKDKGFRDIISGLKYATADTKMPLDLCAAKCSRTITGPFFTDYEKLRALCLSILSFRTGANFFGGNADNGEVSGLLFYSPDLWEVFVEQCMKERLGDIGGGFISQNTINIYSSEVSNAPSSHNGPEYKQEIRPDFVFFADKEKTVPYMVLDAKLKPFKKEKENIVPWSEVPADLDDVTKLMRDMMCFNTMSGGLVFPSGKKEFSEDMEKVRAHYISEYNKERLIYIFVLSIPDVPEADAKANDEERQWQYNEWAKILDGNVDAMIKSLKSALENELRYLAQPSEKRIQDDLLC